MHRDTSGTATDTCLALCRQIGLCRGGVMKSSMKEEAELDLFAEQVKYLTCPRAVNPYSHYCMFATACG